MKAISALVVFLLFLLNLLFTKAVSAAIVINEVSPASNPEWVELYNSSQDSIFLQGYIINFGSDSQNKSFCDNDQIAPNSFRTIILTSSWLNNEGDVVALKNGLDAVDSIGYGSGTSLAKPNSTQSITRSPDGSLNWILTDTPSQQGDPVAFECPTPTPTPTQISASPTPTKTPTPAPIAKPTKTPTIIPTSSAKLTKSITLSPAPTIRSDSSFSTKSSFITVSPKPTFVSKSSNSVLGIKDEEKTAKNEGKTTVGEQKKPSIARLPIIGGVLFLCSACGILVFRKYRKEKELEI